jgi:hypothetical protein
MMNIKTLVMMSTLILLTGCTEPLSREYLLQHPRVLHKEFDRCQNNNSNVAYCDMVVEAAQEFVKLSNTYADNPQTFAQQIMQEENQVVDLQQKLQGAKEDGKAMIEQAYKIQMQHVKVLLAVVAEASSPGSL